MKIYVTQEIQGSIYSVQYSKNVSESPNNMKRCFVIKKRNLDDFVTGILTDAFVLCFETSGKINLFYRESERK